MPASSRWLLQRLAQLRDRLLSLGATVRDYLGERLVLGRLEMLEREILELPPDPRHSEPVRERRIEIARLLRDPLLALGRQELQRPHVVQPVRELDRE